ncbi:MAG: hypothetical protein AAGE80_06145 [Pseudomonadota bacterium]
MTPTDLRPIDADVHTPDHCDHCNEVTCSADPCATQWVARRRRNQAILPTRLPQPVRW